MGCYILYYYTLLLYIIHILLLYILLLYLIILLYLILSSPLICSSSSLLPFPILSSLLHSIRVGTSIYLFIFYQYPISIHLLIFSSPSPSPPLLLSFKVYVSGLPYTYLYSIFFSSSFPSSPPHSFYTCRVFHLLIYIHLSSHLSHSFYTCRVLHTVIYILDNSTPHVLSEWMVEVCRFDVYMV